MRKIILSMALVVLIGAPAAFAQGGASTVPKNSGNKSATIQAPVGHRQPRAGDVPNEKNLSDPNDPLSKENAPSTRRSRASAAAARRRQCTSGQGRDCRRARLRDLIESRPNAPGSCCALQRFRLAATASASTFSAGTVVSQSMQPSVMLWP